MQPNTDKIDLKDMIINFINKDDKEDATNIFKKIISRKFQQRINGESTQSPEERSEEPDRSKTEED